MSIKKSITLDETIEFLNGLIEIDSEAVGRLITARVPCNEAMADHPTVQVGDCRDGFEVGFLGVLNGLFGIDENGWGGITMIFEADKPIEARRTDVARPLGSE